MNKNAMNESIIERLIDEQCINVALKLDDHDQEDMVDLVVCNWWSQSISIWMSNYLYTHWCVINTDIHS